MMKRVLPCVIMLICGSTLPAQPSFEEEALQYLREYLRIDTSNPPGHTLESARFLKSILEREGIATTLYESAPGSKANLLARLSATVASDKKPLLLLHHMDVVPADPARWPLDPFGAILRDGYLWGRGAMDMKAHGITHLMTLIRLKRENVPLDQDVLLLAVADEEIGGGLGAAWMIENHFSQLDPEYVLDEGGFELQGLLSTDKIVFAVSVAEKRLLWLKLTAQGTAGHGSQPIEDNANQILMDALDKILSRPGSVGDHPVLREMSRRIGVLPDNKFTRAIRQNTISLTTLSAGVGNPPKINVIPSVSSATLDCRLLPDESPEEFIQQTRSTINDPRIEIEVVYQSVSTESSSSETPLFRVIEATLKKHYPQAVVSPVIIPYGTDSAQFRRRGVTAYGMLPVIVTPDIMGSLHGDRERIPLEGFQRGIHIFYEIVLNFLEKEVP